MRLCAKVSVNPFAGFSAFRTAVFECRNFEFGATEKTEEQENRKINKPGNRRLKEIEMADFDIKDNLRKAFLAGVGAVAIGVEKSEELVDEFVAKGKMSVEEGKALNTELTRKVKEETQNAQDTMLRTRLAAMSSADRAQYADRVAALVKEFDEESKDSAAGEKNASAK